MEHSQQAETLRRRRVAASAATSHRHRQSSDGGGRRVEVWIAADGSSLSQTQNDNNADEADDLSSLPLVEVDCYYEHTDWSDSH